MIRKKEPADLDRLMEIWLAANLQAHSFVAADYWQSNLALVRQMLPQAEVYVYAEDSSQEILGFVGLDGEYIAGIFVDFSVRSQGIGKKLLDFIKAAHTRLTLRVYQQNERAVQFYQREKFQIVEKSVDTETGVPELQMQWLAENVK